MYNDDPLPWWFLLAFIGGFLLASIKDFFLIKLIWTLLSMIFPVFLFNIPSFFKKRSRSSDTTTAFDYASDSNTSECSSDISLSGYDTACDYTSDSETSPVINAVASSSPSDIFVAGYDYEVFLSFRGSDTRKTFTDHLYTSLIDAGIRAFRDNEELRVGEEIGEKLLKAITQSKICIPIFSNDYASSKWCLKEVAHMVKCRNTGNQLVLPIFYDVKPHQVRDQSGTYMEAFKQHLPKYGETTVREWKEALAEIGGLKGWELQNFADGHEGALVKEVVSKVWMELKKAHLVVSDFITGIEDPAEDVIKLLKVGGDDVRMVVLHGIGGSGKTTLAKMIYNQLLEHFEFHSFLRDIRETSLQPKGLERLQTQLVTNVLKIKDEFTSIDEGIAVLSERLRGKKVLIVLDDVDEQKQMDALAAKDSWFGKGSRIIITCTNTDALVKFHLAGTYEVKGLPGDEALVLFCKHAFRMDSPSDGFEGLSGEIISMSGGLPLALEVTGSFLSGKSKDKWGETIKKLQKQPVKKVEDKLIMSFEALEKEQREIFLDIACFFIGADWKIAAHMWKDCDFFPNIGIDILLARSLIKLRDGNKIWMHDQLKDLGRKIVRGDIHKEPCVRSRLWSTEEAKDVLVSQKGTKEIIGMSLEYGLGIEGKSFETRCFINLSNLRYLRLKNANIMGDFDPQLSELRMLQWNYCPTRFQATGLRLSNLLVLQMSESRITDSWDGWSSMQMADKLKALILQSCCCLTKMPNLSGFPALETLIIENCGELSSVDPSIGTLKNLILLSLKNCSGLGELPQQVSYLRALVELHIDGSGLQKLPTLEGLEKLEVLNANNCMHMSRIPRSIGHLSSLSKLLLDETKVSTLPDSVGDLAKLTCLSLRDCESLLELPDSIKGLTSLKELHLSGASVHTLPKSIGELKNLHVLLVDRTKITHLPSTLANLEKLEVLDASFCTGLPVIKKLCPLKILKLKNTSIEVLPTSISQLSRLETLDLIDCHALQTLPQFPNSLQSLSVTCRHIEIFPNLLNSTFLMELRLFFCSKLINIPGLGSLISLRTLMVFGCNELANLDGLEKLKCLRKLDIAYCRSLQSLPNLSDLKMLSHLSFEECEKLSMAKGLRESGSLEHLKIQGCEAIESLPDLSKLRKLKRLLLARCLKLRELRGLEGLESLKSVDIGYSPSLYHYTKEWPRIRWDDLPRIVGMESHIKGVMESLEIGANDVRIVMIYGRAGIGKTTLAKIIYNQLSKHFAYHSFILNADKTSKQDEGLEMLQRQLLSDIQLSEHFAYHSFISNAEETSKQYNGLEKLERRLLSDIQRPVNPEKFEFAGVVEGKNVINQRLGKKRVLIVLDDINQTGLLDALVPNEVLAPGSRIVITSKNKDALDVSRVTRTYELNEMQLSDALVLFCRHAFGSEKLPPNDLETLSRDIASTVGGFPLALEVLGSFLWGKSEDEWHDALLMIKNSPVEDKAMVILDRFQ